MHSALGYGWSHFFFMTLELYSNEYFPGQITIIDDSGRGVYFSKTEDGLWASDYNEKTSLMEDATGYTWLHLDETKYHFNFNGVLTSIEDNLDNLTIFTYNSDPLAQPVAATDLLLSVTDESTGRTLSFDYNSDNLISSISGPTSNAVADGVLVQYGYDSNSNLTSVTYADGSGFIYEYTDPNDVHNLTVKKNILGQVLATWAYDDEDRAIENITPDGRGGSIKYLNDTTVEVTNAYGVLRTYTLSSHDGVKKVANIAGGSTCQSCDNSSEPIRYAYDDNLNITEKEYANGRLSQYQDYDDKGHPGTIIKNAGTTEQQTSYYTYHPETGAKLSVSTKSLLNPDEYKTTTYDYDNDSNTIANENPTRKLYRKIETGYTMDASQQVGQEDGGGHP